MGALVVELAEREIERIHADLIAVGASPDDRPLRGAAARADWRVCGDLWRLFAARTLSGAFGDASLVSADGALRASSLLVIGLGPRAELGAPRWRELGRETVRRALALRAQRVVAGLASDAAECGADCFRALLEGAAEAAAESRDHLQLVISGAHARELLAARKLLDGLALPPGATLRVREAPGPPPASRRAPTGDFPYDPSLPV
jgi:hypothetical protein